MSETQESIALLTSQLTSFATKVGEDVKVLEGFIGNLTELSTTHKTNLVMAINQLLSQQGTGGVEITEDSESETATLSAKAISQAIKQAVTAAKNELLGESVSADLDTLKELGDALANGNSVAEAINRKLTRQGERLDNLEAAMKVSLVEIYNRAKDNGE